MPWHFPEEMAEAKMYDKQPKMEAMKGKQDPKGAKYSMLKDANKY
jgi:hypothetical protein